MSSPCVTGRNIMNIGLLLNTDDRNGDSGLFQTFFVMGSYGESFQINPDMLQQRVVINKVIHVS